MNVISSIKSFDKKVAGKLSAVKAENMKQFTAVYEKKEDKPFAAGFCLAKLFCLFLLGSFVGFCVETVFSIIAEGHIELRVGMVYGPFIPVYGGGAVLMTVVLYKLYKLNDLFVFLISAALGAFFEYICSWGQEKFLGTVSWDYSKMPLNIGGRTCLLYACFWGVLGLVWLRYLYPLASKYIEKIPKKPGNIILSIVFVFMLINAFLTVTSIYRWNQRVNAVPPANKYEEFLDNRFGDDRMEFLFTHMRDPKSLDELKESDVSKIDNKDRN